MKKIFILGHNGMLGNAVLKYFSISKKENYILYTTDKRFPDEGFKKELINSDAEFIINCIGKIPQKKPESVIDYEILNIELPIFLESLNKKIIHPSTDCEFSGKKNKYYQYKKNDKRDAKDDYGKSKSYISKKIEDEFKNTKIIRVSIIGHELKSSLSLLDWFLSQKKEVNGYTNHFWNGITTLEWAKICESIINNWENYPKLNQFGTKENKSKYELLNIIKNIYKKDIKINKLKTNEQLNKCLKSDKNIKKIESQLIELKKFYKY